jgi:hypothetical protein
MSQHTQRTLKYLREAGYVCDVTERFLSYAGKYGQRKDTFGFMDILCFHVEKKETLAVQSCSTLWGEHFNKILANELALKWLQAGNQIELFGWRKLKVKRGGKAMRWQPRIYRFTLKDFEAIGGVWTK